MCHLGNARQLLVNQGPFHNMLSFQASTISESCVVFCKDVVAFDANEVLNMDITLKFVSITRVQCEYCIN